MNVAVVQRSSADGVGFGHFRDYAIQYARTPAVNISKWGSRLMEHNYFLSILADMRIDRLVLYVIMLVMILPDSLRYIGEFLQMQMVG
jgi:hypothetical protein